MNNYINYNIFQLRELCTLQDEMINILKKEIERLEKNSKLNEEMIELLERRNRISEILSVSKYNYFGGRLFW